MADVEGFRKEMNFRELGGYRSIDDRTVKPELLFRSGALGLLSKEERSRFEELGIRNILDFRSLAKSALLPDPKFSDCNHQRMCAAFENFREDLNNSPIEFIRMLFDEDQTGNFTSTVVSSIHASLVYSNDAYKEMFRILMKKEGPLLIHCTQGKDRTGIGAMLILLALGVNEEQIEYDYLLSNEYRKSIIEKKMKQAGIFHKLSDNVKTAILAKEGVLPEAIHMILAEIQQRYDNYNNFLLEEYSLTEDDLNSLRDYYLE